MIKRQFCQEVLHGTKTSSSLGNPAGDLGTGSDDLPSMWQPNADGVPPPENLWPAIQQAYAWVHQVAHFLANAESHDVDTLKRDYQHLLDTMVQQQGLLGALAPAVPHFQKVTASYWDGLFHCYQVKDLPRTNNDLEQYFCTARHIERRVTGRKRASPTLVVAAQCA